MLFSDEIFQQRLFKSPHRTNFNHQGTTGIPAAQNKRVNGTISVRIGKIIPFPAGRTPHYASTLRNHLSIDLKKITKS